MAKRGVPDHPKTLRLARVLGVQPWMAVGLLECLWHWAAQYAIDGEIAYEPQDVADGLRYDGDAQGLFDALTDCGWLDETPDGRTIVHGWSEHADDATNARLYRAVRRFADGTKPAPRSIGRQEREALDAQWTSAEQGADAVTPPPDEPKPTPDICRTSNGHMPDVLPLPLPRPRSRRPPHPAPLRGAVPPPAEAGVGTGGDGPGTGLALPEEPPWWDSLDPGDPARAVAETVAACRGPGSRRWYADPGEEECRNLADRVLAIVGPEWFADAWEGLGPAFVEYHDDKRKPPYESPVRALTNWARKREPDWRRLVRSRKADAAEGGYMDQARRVAEQFGGAEAAQLWH